MSNTIKILILEDSESDIFLIERQLKKNKLNYILKHTDNEIGFKNYLKDFEPDIILSDYNLPNFTGLDALNIAIKHHVYIPFIIVTGALDDETAVSCIKSGADDYLTKEKLTRLASAIQSAIDKRNAFIEKEKAEKETKQIAKELQVLIQTVNTPIFGIDLDGAINEWNKAAKNITNYSKKSVLGKNFIKNFIHESQQDKMHQIFNETIKGTGITNFEILLKTKSTVKQLLLNTTTRKDEAGNLNGIVLIGQDITEIVNYREELEQKIEERTKKLRKALENEKELSELKSRFISMASHEFRTPLAAIGFTAGFIKKYHTKIEADILEKKLDKINNQVFHMTEMLDDVLTIGKADAKKEFKPKEIDFNLFIHSIIEEVKIATKHTHDIKFKSTHEKIKIELDTKFGRNIFTNLLSNAIKFSPKKEFIFFENTIENGNLISKITDFGIGIPTEDLESVFAAFHRAKNTENIQGTGLGLAIVKEAVESHNGSIKIENKQKEGTSFIVTLPLKHKKKP